MPDEDAVVSHHEMNQAVRHAAHHMRHWVMPETNQNEGLNHTSQWDDNQVDQGGGGSKVNYSISLLPEEIMHILEILEDRDQEDLNSTSPNITSTSEGPLSLYNIIVPVMLFFCAVAVLVNVLILITVRWVRKPMSPTLRFSVSLAGADAYAAFVLAAGLVVNSLLPAIYGQMESNCFGLALEAFRLGGVIVTVVHLLALAINHYVGIVKPLQYAATVTRRTANLSIIAMWIIPLLLFNLYFFAIPDQGFRSQSCTDISFIRQRKFRIVFSCLFFAPLIIMSFVYAHVFIIVRRHTVLRIRTRAPLRKSVKAAITTLLIVGTCIIGWLPAVIWFILVCDDCMFSFDQIDQNIRVPISITCNALIILKAIADPVIYAARMSEIQQAIRRMRRGCCGSFCGYTEDVLDVTGVSQQDLPMRYSWNARLTDLKRTSAKSNNSPNRRTTRGGNTQLDGANGHLSLSASSSSGRSLRSLDTPKRQNAKKWEKDQKPFENNNKPNNRDGIKLNGAVMKVEAQHNNTHALFRLCKTDSLKSQLELKPVTNEETILLKPVDKATERTRNGEVVKECGSVNL